MTGGISASDEYVEIANAGSTDADLGGFELVYVTATGATIARKAGFTAPLLLAPGQHLLVANAAGIYGPLADATYAEGLAADGGAVALRRGDGTVVDAVGWGTAANSYVEGSAAPAPPAKSSIERLPGGSGGNTQDTNDNRADWFVQPNPVPQSLVSAPLPGPSTSPTASPSASPSTPPTASLTPAPTTTLPATLTATAVVTPSLPASGSPEASSSPTQSAPALESISAARAQLAGTRAHVAGMVSAETGLVGAEGLLAIQDSSGGIYVRLATAVAGLAIGTFVELDGVLAAPYGQLEIRNLGSLTVGEGGPEPVPSRVALTDVGEQTEGCLVTVGGTVASVETDSGRITLTIGDGTHSIHAMADPPTGLSRSDVIKGDAVLVTGIVGQRATATGRLDGYRLWLRRRADLAVTRDLPSGSPSPAPLPSRASVPTGVPVYHELASALKTRGAALDFEAGVTATAGLLDIGKPTIVVDDGTAAVAVTLPDDSDVPPVGMRVHVIGKVGRWQSGPTVLASQVSLLGEMQAIAPRTLTGSLTGSLEWRLVRACGRVQRFVRAGIRWRVDMLVGGHEISVLGEPAASVVVDKSSVGRLAVVSGIVRRSTSDNSSFQLLPRTALDFRLGPAPNAPGAAVAMGSAGGSGAGANGADASLGPADGTVAIGSLSSYLGRRVTVSGLVTGTTRVAATIDDGTGEVRFGGPAIVDALAMLEAGDAIEVTGTVQQDGQGLIVEADPESMIDVPGAHDASAGVDGGLPAAAAAARTTNSTTSRPPTASLRRTSSSGLLPDGLTIAVLLLVVGVLAAAAVAFARRAGGHFGLRQ
jgi:hypothetical protein